MGVSSFSIVVCTADRPKKLASLLRSFSELIVPPHADVELIVVNNRPRTDLRPVVREWADRLRFPIALHRENRRGLGAARNNGVERSQGEVVAFTDDDCLVAPQWLVGIDRAFTGDAELMGIGGRVELHDQSAGDITVRRGEVPEVIASVDDIFGFLHGCNMAFRRSVFDRVGLFDPDFGNGSRVNSGDDAEFLYRTLQAGAKVCYRPDALVYHDHGRVSAARIRAALTRYQLANGALLAKHCGATTTAGLLRSVSRAALGNASDGDGSLGPRLRSWYRAAVFGVGALHYRAFVARVPESES